MANSELTDGNEDKVAEKVEGKQAAVIVQGLLAVVKEAKSRLQRAEIPSVVVPAPDDAPKDPRGPIFLLAIDPSQVEAAQNLLVGTGNAPVVDFNSKEMTCPACSHKFPTGPKECPDCELFLG